MKRTIIFLIFTALAMQVCCAQAVKDKPKSWKWVNNNKVAFTFDGSYTDSLAFSYNIKLEKTVTGVRFPERFRESPIKPKGAKNITFSPDSTKIAYTLDGDLYVATVADSSTVRLTTDGSDLILNGFASWVYYEEILGRASNYKAFWWSPDSRKIGFYRFDNSCVPMFPIYSPKGQDGTLALTRYPKAGENNPKVRIGIVDADGASEVVWADFDENEDHYFGTPFWGKDSKSLFVAREPRVQNTLDLYAVSAADGSKQHIYHETYKTWLNWISGMLFTDEGLYMARDFETGWQQIYFLSYDGKTFKRLTNGENWRVNLLKADPDGTVYFLANRDSDVRTTMYSVNRDGWISALTDPKLNVSSVKFSPDGKHFIAAMSNYTTPDRYWVYDLAKRRGTVVYDTKGPEFDQAAYCLPKDTRIEIDGLQVPAFIIYPEDFDPSKKYPVHMEIYGGPNTAYVTDKWRTPDSYYKFFAQNGIIHITADCRASGHNGREGVDLIFKDLTSVPVNDFVQWAKWLKSLPYVDGSRIGVEGFSFGGTMTSLLVMTRGEWFSCGIAGGGVYDWALYDSHYTERFMLTPDLNPEGYDRAKVISYVKGAPKELPLKLTHGTGDDNVHFQNTLQLVDTLQRAGKQFEMMIYPDGKHGYRGAQDKHSWEADKAFWTRYLLK